MNQTKIYKANKSGPIIYLLIGSVLLFIVIFFFGKNNIIEKPFILIPLLSPIALVLWLYFDTSYKIENNNFFYRSGFLRGTIDIKNIREIIVGKTMWVGIKPALVKNGLIVKFNRFDEIYIAPINNQELVADLLKINTNIKVS